MEYVKVRFNSDDLRDDPILFYSEIDANRWEVRKVEVFRDGSYSYAGKGREHLAMLALIPFPGSEELSQRPELEFSQISKEEFEGVWREAHENT
jgi:hypothetical protein